MNSERDFIDTSIPIEILSIRVQGLRKEKQTPRTAKAIERIGFVQLRYQGFSVRKSSEIMGISTQTGYNWQNSWNESQMDSVFPQYGGGRTSRMTDEQKRDFLNAVSSNCMSTMEAQQWLIDTYGLDYSLKQVHVNLKKMGMRHIPVRKLGDIPRQGRDDSSPRMRWVR